jgi:REP element-mobilizing transposase RayT
VRTDELLEFGKATKVDGRRNVARRSHDWKARLEAKKHLKYPAVVLNGRQALAAAHGFAEVVRKNGYVVHACAIMPKHLHLVIAAHSYSVEQVVNLMKGAASRALTREGLHPLAGFEDRRGRTPSPWQEECGHEFLFTPADMRRAIDYVERNPMKEGLPPQQWSFVTPYKG